ncbi:MAG: hypothetical protein ACJLTB_12195 [Algoriphagus aquaeductus]|uniref:hypothetical protein n=1 Tax=Algoriphagus aquaeductus TaxID=475299 RepID=UPI00387A1BD3
MNQSRPYPILRWVRHQYLTKGLLWLIVFNFINLSVNFQESNINLHQAVDMDDPIDTLGELVYEWALDGDCDVIPDNGTEQEDKSLKKGKVWGIAFDILAPVFYNQLKREMAFSAPFILPSRTLFKDSPPPDLS